MTNKYKPHVVVLPEDDANRQIANGFAKHPAVAERILEVRGPSGGWPSLREIFHRELVPSLRRYPSRSVVLLVDFDEQSDRRAEILRGLPLEFSARVFLLGAWSEPERLKPDLGSYETIGAMIASDCAAGGASAWDHRLLQHNRAEALRLRDELGAVLFVST